MARNGIDYLGKNSFRDFNVTIKERIIGHPSKKKIKEEIPFSNQVYDFSSVYGRDTYTERKLTYRFNIANRAIETKEEMTQLKTMLVNWLFSSNGKEVLHDPYYPHYYFLAEVEDAADFKENWLAGTLDVDFVAYPFMISEYPEGHDLWDAFNFNMDVVQPRKYRYTKTGKPMKELNVGDQATIAPWAASFVNSSFDGWAGEISPIYHDQSYEVLEKRNINFSRSKRAYRLGALDEWILEQDVINVQTEFLKFDLINTGITPVFPNVKTNKRVVLKIGDSSIVLIDPGAYKSLNLPIKPGRNPVEIQFGSGTLEFEFEWYKELI